MMNPKLPLMSAEEYAKLRPAIKDFEKRVWFGGLKKYINAHDARGHRTDIEHLTIMMFSLAGRTMITFRDAGDNWLSLMVATDPESPSMGLHERSISPDTIIEWLEFAAANWQAPSQDDKVMLDVLAYTQKPDSLRNE
jgi:hypothetical protein